MDKDALRKKIEQKIGWVQKDIEDLTELTQPIAPENSIGRVSRMDAINNKSINEAALRRAKEKLSSLQSAWQKIDEPDFGLCERCGEAIPEGRILIMPQSPLCVSCARQR